MDIAHPSFLCDLCAVKKIENVLYFMTQKNLARFVE